MEYQNRLARLVKLTPQALCGAPSCAKAMDEGPLGSRDISSRIVVGEPVHIGGLNWKVPYDVSDEAGNTASTVYRMVCSLQPLDAFSCFFMLLIL